jgi:transposase
VDEFLAEPNRQVFFFDEGRFGLQPLVGRCWARKRCKSYSMVKPGYKNFYVFSGVSPHTGESFSLFLPWVNTEIMNLYLEELSLAYPEQELMLIMDQAGWHKAKDLIVPKNIRIEFLTPYSPELNPVEKLWQWLKRHICRNRLFPTEENLMNVLSDTLQGLSGQFLATLCHCSYL